MERVRTSCGNEVVSAADCSSGASGFVISLVADVFVFGMRTFLDVSWSAVDKSSFGSDAIAVSAFVDDRVTRRFGSDAGAAFTLLRRFGGMMATVNQNLYLLDLGGSCCAS